METLDIYGIVDGLEQVTIHNVSCFAFSRRANADSLSCWAGIRERSLSEYE